MKLHSARCLALLLALMATAGAAHAQQYPYQYAGYADGPEDAPPPPDAGVAAPLAVPPAAPLGSAPGMAVQPPMGDGLVGGYAPAQSCAGGAQGYAGDAACGDNCGHLGCCNDGCGLHCGDCCLPGYIYFKADVIFMDRTNARNQPITSVGVGPGNIVLNTGGLGFSAQPFGRFLIGVPVSDCTAVEISYLGLQNWQSRAFFQSAAGNLFSAYTLFGTNRQGFVAGQVNDIDQSTLQAINYISRMHNAEFNFATRLPWSHSGRGRWDLVHGVRWIEINEQFNYLTTGVNSSATRVSTFNDLIGYQGGIRWEADLNSRLHFSVDPKAGVYANISAMRSAYTSTSAAASGEFARRDEVAVAADCSAILTYDIKPWLSLRGGYNVMYVGGVALAPENFVARPIPTGNIPRFGNVNNTGAILYHGASAGIEARF